MSYNLTRALAVNVDRVSPGHWTLIVAIGHW